MKALSFAFVIASAILIGGCTDPIERPVSDDAQQHFQRGITGQGKLGPIDQTDDPYIKARESSSSHP